MHTISENTDKNSTRPLCTKNNGPVVCPEELRELLNIFLIFYDRINLAKFASKVFQERETKANEIFHQNMIFLQNEILIKNEIIKSLTDTQGTILEVLLSVDSL